MTQSKLRILICSLWLGFWVISTLMLLLTPVLRSDNAIGYEQIPPEIHRITSIWIPALTCFALLWFPKEERARARERKPTTEQKFGAIAFTMCYLSILLLLFLWPCYIVPYSTPGELPPGASFAEQMADGVKYGLTLSPIALAPTHFFTAPPQAKDST